MKMISSAHDSRSTIDSDVNAIESWWHGSAVNKINDFIPFMNQPIFWAAGLPGVTQDLAAMRWVSLHITGERQGGWHKCHTIAKIIVYRIQLELSLLCKTYRIKKYIALCVD